jgi:hypothetical protein
LSPGHLVTLSSSACLRASVPLYTIPPHEIRMNIEGML